jgi:hypothetical protein
MPVECGQWLKDKRLKYVLVGCVTKQKGNCGKKGRWVIARQCSLSRLLPSEEVILLDDKKFHIQTAMVVATVWPVDWEQNSPNRWQKVAKNIKIASNLNFNVQNILIHFRNLRVPITSITLWVKM